MSHLVHHDVLDRLADELLGQLVLGLGLLRRGLRLVFVIALVLVRLLGRRSGGGWRGGRGLLEQTHVRHGDRRQGEVALDAGLELALAAGASSHIPGQVPGEEVLIVGYDLGPHPIRVVIEGVDPEEGARPSAVRIPSSRPEWG